MGIAASSTPGDTARTIARNAVHVLHDALDLIDVAAVSVEATDEVVKGHGRLVLVLESAEGYGLARWIRSHLSDEEWAAANVRAQAK